MSMPISGLTSTDRRYELDPPHAERVALIEEEQLSDLAGAAISADGSGRCRLAWKAAGPHLGYLPGWRRRQFP